VPKQRPSGGKQKLGSISKQGDRYLRGLFTAGVLAVIRYAKIRGTGYRPWLSALLARRPTKVAAARLKQLGSHTEVVETTGHGQGRTSLADAVRNGRFDAVLAAAGDGTVHDTVEGLVCRLTPVGIIPMGTGFDPARQRASKLTAHWSPS
jgi:Diacylglycerol kinase catalytic domain/Transposase IS116/IS110/IS902 family